MMEHWLQEIELEHDGIKLMPLRKTHRSQLLQAASDGKLSELWFTSAPDEKTIDNQMNAAIEAFKNGTSLPFVVVDSGTDTIIGSTRFCNAEATNKRLEIGYTWYAASYQKTKTNTICKLLLLQHAFENLGCIAVEFRTNWFNFKSREAILRLGAKQDGVLRNHRLDHNGLVRDTVVFSILNTEWPAVKKNLQFKLQRYKNA